jgi:hypothetical protein
MLKKIEHWKNTKHFAVLEIISRLGSKIFLFKLPHKLTDFKNPNLKFPNPDFKTQTSESTSEMTSEKSNSSSSP